MHRQSTNKLTFIHSAQVNAWIVEKIVEGEQIVEVEKIIEVEKKENEKEKEKEKETENVMAAVDPPAVVVDDKKTQELEAIVHECRSEIESLKKQVEEAKKKAAAELPPSSVLATAAPTPTSAPTQQSTRKLKDDPKFSKYFKMLKMGLPVGAAVNKGVQDGLDANELQDVLSKDPESDVACEGGGVPLPLPLPPAPTTIKLKDDPQYSKYFKMLKMGLPVGAAVNKAVQDGLDAGLMQSVLTKDPESEIVGTGEPPTPAAAAAAPPAAMIIAKDHPKFSKYFKMLKMGLPVGAAVNKGVQDGLDASELQEMLSKDPESEIEDPASAKLTAATATSTNTTTAPSPIPSGPQTSHRPASITIQDLGLVPKPKIVPTKKVSEPKIYT